MKASKKPVVIDYYDFKENSPEERLFQEWIESFGDRYIDIIEHIFNKSGVMGLAVKTLEGISYEITVGDVIIRDVKGEYYPYKKDIFELTYDKIN